MYSHKLRSGILDDILSAVNAQGICISTLNVESLNAANSILRTLEALRDSQQPLLEHQSRDIAASFDAHHQRLQQLERLVEDGIMNLPAAVHYNSNLQLAPATVASGEMTGQQDTTTEYGLQHLLMSTDERPPNSSRVAANDLTNARHENEGVGETQRIVGIPFAPQNRQRLLSLKRSRETVIQHGQPFDPASNMPSEQQDEVCLLLIRLYAK